MHYHYEVLIPYSQITPLSKQLKQDSSLKSHVKRPPTRPDNPNEEVRITIRVETEGRREQKRLVEENIRAYCGRIIGKPVEVGKVATKTAIREFGEDIWPIALSAYLGTVGATMAYDYSKVLDGSFNYLGVLLTSLISAAVLAIGFGLAQRRNR